MPCVGLRKWRMEIRAIPADVLVWQSNWKSYREEKINHFLWQLVHRINATKHYIGVRSNLRNAVGAVIPFARLNPAWWCSRCDSKAHEDILLHCQWLCRDSSRIWMWIQLLMQTAVGDGASSFRLVWRRLFWVLLCLV